MTGQLARVLLGTAVGDSIGLPAEGLPPQRIRSRWPGLWRQRFFFGRGMVSDDTEHTVFIAQCLMLESSDPAAFQRRLAWKLRLWLLCVPAGIGFATLRAILKLWLGFPPTRSGVFSAGNGPAMRSAIIGAYFADDAEKLRSFVSASTRLTHTDPRAETAALSVALTAAWTSNTGVPPGENLPLIEDIWRSAGPTDAEWTGLVQKLMISHEREDSVREFADSLGLGRGVTGYAYHSVPVALYAWLHHHGDFRACIEAVLDCGGDTDTVGAIAGALSAISGSIPQTWLDGLRDYPISTDYLRELASALEVKKHGGGKPAPFFPWMFLPVRNLFFLLIVLVHGLRRLVPF